MFGLGTQELIVIFMVLLLIFGGKKLPELARGLGKGIREFKNATREIENDLKSDELEDKKPPKSGQQ
ncbi:twin-arginine translocase TatA/TatE family subunit [candidate division KSB1 bacterium]